MRYLIDLHTHTIASDHAYSTIHDYIRQAQESGMLMFACTDHGPALADGAHQWHFHNLRVVPRLADGVAILRGAEANILEDGEIDLDEASLGRLDLIIAGFHPCSPQNSDAKAYTRMLIRLIESGRVDILAHPGNPRFPFDYETVLECALEHQVAVEINASSSVNTRMGSHDNCVSIAKIASRLGNIVSLGTDAHISYFLGNFEESLRVIKESGLNEALIINRSPQAVLDFLERRGHPPIPELRAHFGQSQA
ncbi:MAG: phosphatase [Succinivibrio sp.]|nr:phosphatase [Succinivibrio sp.]